MAQSNVKLTVDGSQATRALSQVNRQTNVLTKSVGILRNAFLGLGTAAVAKNFINTSTSMEKLRIRLELLTKENGTYKESLDLVEQAQKKFGVSGSEALEGVTNLQARLGPLGASMEDIAATFNGFTTAAILSGASAQEQAGAMRQLTQALGSGVLRGDEFNSISEQMSTILKPVAKQLNVNVGALRDMAAEGKITAEVVIAALKDIEVEGAAAIEELLKRDPTMVFKLLKNETEELAKAVGDVLSPAVAQATNALRGIVEVTTQLVQEPLVQAVALVTAVGLAGLAAKAAFGVLATATGVLIAKMQVVGILAMAQAGGFSAMATSALLAAKGVSATAVAFGALQIAMSAVPFIAIAGAITGITAAIIGQRKERQKLTDVIKKGTTVEIDAELQKLEIQSKKIGEKLEGAGGHNKRSLSKRKKRIDLLIEELNKSREIAKANEDQAAAVEKTNKKLDEQKALYQQIGDQIASGITDGLVSAIEGAKTLGEVAQGILRDLANTLLKLSVNTLLKSTGAGIFAGLQGFASGGYTSGKKPIVVGEKGPEIFMPQGAGNVISNNSLSRMTPETPQGGGGSVTVNYDGPILNFNQEEFVPKSAVNDIIQSASVKGAALGEQRTLSRLQNSRRTRSALQI